MRCDPVQFHIRVPTFAGICCLHLYPEHKNRMFPQSVGTYIVSHLIKAAHAHYVCGLVTVAAFP